MFRPETDWVKRWAHYTPNRRILREHKRNLEWSYSEFNSRANRLAQFLVSERKLKKGDRIAVLSKNSSEYMLLFFACVKSGLILVPLNFRLTPRELDLLLHDADPSLFYFESEFAESVDKLQSLGDDVQKVDISEITPMLLENPGEIEFCPEWQIDEEDVVKILYTAGTTGLSKGAMVTHKMMFWNSINTEGRLDITSQDHTQAFAPFFHTGGWNVLVTPFVHHGASTTLIEGFDVELILRLMEEEKTTLFWGVPTMMQMLADSPNFDKTNLSSVRFAIVGGAPMPEPLINIWHEKGVFIRQGYGLTEVGPNTFSLHQDDAIRKRGSIGFPNFYIHAKIMGESGAECGINQPGELCLQSPVVTPGYWRNEEKTRESIIDNWFHTGDIVQKDEEGFFYVVDRKKNMFISGGENVYPADVEKFLLTNEGIKEVAVIGVPSEKWGEVGAAFIVTKSGEKISEEEIRKFCLGHLAKYKIPAHVYFLNKLPTNEAGKINRIELKKLHDKS